MRAASSAQSPFLLSDTARGFPLPEKNDVMIILINSRRVLRLLSQDIFCSTGNILITKGNPHFQSDRSEPEEWLLLKEDFFDSMFLFQITDCPLFYDFLRSQSESARLFHFDTFPNEISWNIAKILFFEASKGTKALKTVHAACILLFTNLHEVHREKLLIGHSTMMTEHKIGAVLTYMSNHFRDLTLESTAEAFHYNPSYFSVWFKKNAHITFSRQLLKIRLEQSKFLLRETALPVRTIIEEVGFQEKSHFHRCFKQEYGVTPLAYRKMKHPHVPL